MNHLIEMYIEDKKLAWAPSTLKSEAARLRAHVGLLSMEASEAWTSLDGLKPYTKVTTWTRLSQLVDWAIGAGHLVGPNHFSLFRTKNARLFKHTYTRQPAALGFNEAETAIQSIADQSTRTQALLLLYTGLRYHELSKVSGGKVAGKGGRVREVYLPEVQGPAYTGTYHAFWRALSQVGLKPHMLRKIALNRVVELGANVFELKEIAGWASLETADSYIKANNGRKKALMEKLHGR